MAREPEKQWLPVSEMHEGSIRGKKKDVERPTEKSADCFKFVTKLSMFGSVYKVLKM